MKQLTPQSPHFVVTSEILISAKTITKARIKELAAQCFIKQGEPLKLAKPKKELSGDADAIENFLPTFSDL